MPHALNSLSLLFADDTTFLNKGKHLDTLVMAANTELSKACCWFNANKLTLNASKTKFMIFPPQGKTIYTYNNISIDGDKIERTGEKFQISRCQT